MKIMAIIKAQIKISRGVYLFVGELYQLYSR